MNPRWTAESIPPELVAILDEQAGKQHSPGGSVRRCLADILNAYDEMRASQTAERIESAPHPCQEPDNAYCACADLQRKQDAAIVRERLPAMSLKVDGRIRPGMVVAVGANVGALDVDTGEIVVINPEADEGAAYLAAVKAPLSNATIDTLAAMLAGGQVPRRKVRRQAAGSTDGDDGCGQRLATSAWRTDG